MRIPATDRRAALGGGGGAVIDASDTAISADQRPNMLTRRPGGAAVTHLHTQCSHYSDLYKPTGDRPLFDCELTA